MLIERVPAGFNLTEKLTNIRIFSTVCPEFGRAVPPPPRPLTRTPMKAGGCVQEGYEMTTKNELDQLSS